MRFVSLFAGVGGFDLGFEKAGMTCVGQVEIDPNAQGVLKRHWPSTPKHDDVRTAKEWADEQGLVGTVDLVCGGFPCQDVSVAGRRAGLAGERSGLFWDALSFATHVKARWIVLENVAGLFSSNQGRDFPAVVSALSDAGYSHIEWRMFDSQFYGVPQRRRRVYIVGHIGEPSRWPILVERESLRGHLAPGDEEREGTASAPTASPASRHWLPVMDVSGPLTTAATRSPRGTETSDSGFLAIAGYAEGSYADFNEGVGTLRASGGTLGGGSETLVVEEPVLIRMREGKPGGGKGPLLSEGKSLTLATGNDQTLIAPAAAFVKIIRSGARDADGNLPPEVWAERQVAPTLNRMGNTGEARATVLPTQHSVVRRLTPVECERLQGFPDDWTIERWDFKKQHLVPQTDSARYKQMGNAVTVNVVEWVGAAIMQAENP